MSADKGSGALAELKTSWVLEYGSSPFKYASASSLAVIKKVNGSATALLALAYQASEESHEGSRGQHLRFTLSKDGGDTWGESKCVMWGSAPLWNPVLHYDAGRPGMSLLNKCAARRQTSQPPSVGRCPGWEMCRTKLMSRQLLSPWEELALEQLNRSYMLHLYPRTCLCAQSPCTADSSRLFLFYCESRKSLSPGGDIKYIASPDLGESWAPPLTIYSHEAEEEVPKVCGARLLAAADGSWYLPVHREPAESWHTFAGTSFHPLNEAPEKQLQLAAPPGAAAQVRCGWLAEKLPACSHRVLPAAELGAVQGLLPLCVTVSFSPHHDTSPSTCTPRA
jgi:hypothetical protein